MTDRIIDTELTGQLVIRDQRQDLIAMTQSTDDQAISATNAANTGAQVTNTGYAQQTIQQQNNELFSQRALHQASLNQQEIQHRDSLNAQEIAHNEQMFQATQQAAAVQASYQLALLTGTIIIVP